VIKPNLLFPLGALAAFVFAGAFAQPAPVQTEKVQTISATVARIDAKQRLVELKKGDEVRTIQVPAEVRNFDKIKVGDEVAVTYYEGLAAEFKKKGTGTPIGTVDATTGTARMPEGSGRPGAAVGNRVKTTVVIESVDKATHSVTFTGPAGMTRTVDVVDPKAQKFIAELKKGDEVELTYVEALAVTVEPKLAK
jgi:preprotein translocase subunit YajC